LHNIDNRKLKIENRKLKWPAKLQSWSAQGIRACISSPPTLRSGVTAFAFLLRSKGNIEDDGEQTPRPDLLFKYFSNARALLSDMRLDCARAGAIQDHV
jgi:hypothetical protein